MIQLNINTDAMVALTVKLGNLNRSALPVAVRQTLNDAAFDVKQRTLDKSAKDHFIRRAPTFFKKFSGVNRASGFNINSMRAEVGMTANGNQTANTAVHHMNQQESGGTIAGGADYLKAARNGNNARKVNKANYFNKSKLVAGPFKRKGTTKSNFVAAAAVGLMQNKLVSINTSNGRFLMQVLSITGNRKGGIKIKTKLMIKDRKGISITGTHFSMAAAMMTLRRMDEFYLKEATKQFDRVLK